MTPREALLTCQKGSDFSTVCVDAQRKGFDVVPVTENERITGVLLTKVASSQPLTHEWLVSNDTGIVDLLNLFVESGRPGFLVFRRQEAVGLVTPADFNKLPARVCLYNLIAELEVALVAFVSSMQQFHPALSEEISLAVEDRKRLLKSGDADVEPAQLLCLSDFVNIIVKQEILRKPLGFQSRTKAEDLLNGLVDLRNRIMHPTRQILEQIPKDLDMLHERIEQARDMLDTLELHELATRIGMKAKGRTEADL
jgi:hypothetical protein